jgi:hypothetical protein
MSAVAADSLIAGRNHPNVRFERSLPLGESTSYRQEV